VYNIWTYIGGEHWIGSQFIDPKHPKIAVAYKHMDGAEVRKKMKVK
jgi:hypothetical protein